MPLLQMRREKVLPCAITHRATGLALQCMQGVCTGFAHSLAEDARQQPLGTAKPSFHLMERLRSSLDRILPAHAHVLVHGRLYVSLTAVNTFQNRLVFQFPTREDLVQVLLSICFVPIYSGLNLVEFQGQVGGAVRGGVGGSRSLLLPPGGRTLTISPFCGRHGISPRDPGQGLGSCMHVTGQDVEISTANVARLARALFPPSRGSLESLHHDGFCDAVSFLRCVGRFW
ncbi:patatin-like phospholipase domain-containing protein 4 [Phodopus roborovskii]|uniref:patatin-like phospholipase domain-containing protein 4 n=1 Tax=Phodopus roborovskii TaxID=109678 RepID=UPI0021E485AE|nr:patatin-like phospholipase domain-containing protein 4 [Phodopus roborovskii]